MLRNNISRDLLLHTSEKSPGSATTIIIVVITTAVYSDLIKYRTCTAQTVSRDCIYYISENDVYAAHAITAPQPVRGVSPPPPPPYRSP